MHCDMHDLLAVIYAFSILGPYRFALGAPLLLLCFQRTLAFVARQLLYNRALFSTGKNRWQGEIESSSKPRCRTPILMGSLPTPGFCPDSKSRARNTTICFYFDNAMYNRIIGTLREAPVRQCTRRSLGN